ncbi:DUF969 domain-containing protein [Clostridium ihumii]|uniref:DUF969 domain-containing protein n=1 Tax=Clostridium ihumii TaxID=1470356 RepID=UPI00058D418E|nr:DUF969 domain-containing protein [Clostridium ihumii]
MTLIGIIIVIIGFALKLDTIAVVLGAGIVTGLVADINIMGILETLGSTFVAQRHMSLFILTLPVIGMCERYGLKERAIELIRKAKNLSTGKMLTLYLFIRESAAAASVRLGGHAQFIRPLINPMAQGAAISKYGKIDEKTEEKIKGAAAAMENYGNFFAQNVFMASSGVLLIAGTLEELGYAVNTLDVAKASIPIAIIAFILVALQNHMLDKSIEKANRKND